METKYLETLIAIAEGGSVAAAARRQGLSATSVTQRLQALEAEMGIRLATRVGREVRLTPAGEDVLEQARRVVAAVAGLTMNARSASDHVLRGTVRLGAISTALTGLLPPVLAGWSRSHPDVSFNITPGNSAQLFDGLFGGDFDAVIGVEPPFILPKTLRTRVLRREPLVCLAPARAVEELEGPDPTSDEAVVRGVLEGQRFIRYDITSWGGRICDRYLQEQGITVSEFCSLDALEAIALLVDNGVGAALVPDWAQPWTARDSTRRLPIVDPAYARTILLAHPVQTRQGHLLSALGAALSCVSP